ncbi:MAG: hypothetical protein K9J27_07550 [Bacteroidales bacterium]|nr:hypothetical protein [Bacteroidales bacterium]MCF8333494.1 hypothetical protein [Bacteroidales bacterium]
MDKKTASLKKPRRYAEDSSRINKLAVTWIVILVIVIILSPLLVKYYIQMISFFEIPESSETIAIIISPFVGLLSALLVYFSFRSQQKTSQFLFERGQYYSNLEFIYYRLEELHEFNKNEYTAECIKNINKIFKDLKNKPDSKGSIPKEKEIAKTHGGLTFHSLLHVQKYISLYKVVINQLIGNSSFFENNTIQKEYIILSLKYSYNTVIGVNLKNSRLESYEELFNKNTVAKGNALMDILKDIKVIKDFINKNSQKTN